MRLVTSVAVSFGVTLIAMNHVSAASSDFGGRSFQEAPPALTSDETVVRDRLRSHVHALAGDIGERNYGKPRGLERARAFLREQLAAAGCASTELPFPAGGQTFHNLEAVLPGSDTSAPAIVLGAHYDSVGGSPGANDNASGVAVLLELARSLHSRPHRSTIRIVAFTNEEPPYFNTQDGMGSMEYVRTLERPERTVKAMLSIETVGYYSDEPNSQHYPGELASQYPDRGNFIGFVGDSGAAALVGRTIAAFRQVATLPSEAAALPADVPGVMWSDHRSFRDAGVPAIMVTDTAPFRDPHYHRSTDTPEHLDYDRMARLVTGLVHVVRALDE